MTHCPHCGNRLVASSETCSFCGKPLAPSLLATLEPADGGAIPPAQQDFLVPGTVLAGRYRVIEFVGRGGMGEVIRAEDQALDQTVALKFLPPNLADDSRALERVRTEVRMARLVSHPNVCRVHDLGTIHGRSFISMEYIDGEDLAALLRRVGRLAGNRALEIARELCAGLAAAHAAGVIHRDLKPANIMLDRQGRVRITDFGLALTGEESTTVAEVFGTPAYMAPEQLAGTGATVKSDLYALGLVLYELLTGHRVFSATTMSELLRQRRETTIIPPAQLVREIDPAVEATILHCLAMRPEQRPNSALEVLSALSGGDPLKAALAAGQTPSPSAVAAAPVRGVLKPWVAWACVAVVLVAVVLFANHAWRSSVLGRIGSHYPPEVLAVKAEDAMHALGYSTSCAYNASGFTYNDDALRAAVTTSVDPAQRAAAERRMILFWRRCSPVPILPVKVRPVPGEVTPDDPPLGPGDALTVLDLNGRVFEYQTLPGEQTGESKADPFAAFFVLAGLNPVLRTGLPVQDGHASFDAKLDSSIPVAVEFDLNGGKLASARVVPPWTMPKGLPTIKILQLNDFPDILVLIMILSSIPLAVSNLRAGRGDQRGALRVALLVFGCDLVGIVLHGHHELTLTYEMIFLIETAAQALYRGVTASLLYLALEPFVRRVWPESLVSWTRLLSGNWRDPMVGRDLLIGTTATWIVYGLWSLATMLSNHHELFVMKRVLQALFGLRYCAAITAVVVAQSVRIGLTFLLLLLLLRVFSRIRWLAPLVLFLVIVGFMTSIVTTDSGMNLIPVSLAIVWGVVVVFILARFGLLAVIAVNFFGMLGGFLPDAARLTEWASLCLWWQAGLAVLLSLYGLYFATGRKPFGDGKLFEA